jgi:hypothetical protein
MLFDRLFRACRHASALIQLVVSSQHSAITQQLGCCAGLFHCRSVIGCTILMRKTAWLVSVSCVRHRVYLDIIIIIIIMYATENGQGMQQHSQTPCLFHANSSATARYIQATAIPPYEFDNSHSQLHLEVCQQQ